MKKMCQATATDLEDRQKELREFKHGVYPPATEQELLRQAKQAIAQERASLANCIDMVHRSLEAQAGEQRRSEEYQAHLAAEDAKRAARAEQLRQRRGMAEWARPALSAQRCAFLEMRRRTLANIEKEKKYSRIGGVIDKAKLYGFQQRIRACDEGVESIDQELRRDKLPPLKCGDKRIAPLTPCMPMVFEGDTYVLAEDPDATCQAPEVRQYAELLEPDEGD